jgi:hypothetical protein
MRRSLFVKIVETCVAKTRYFKHRRNAVVLLGFSGYQKISMAMRVLAYGILADYADEYLRIGEGTTMESVRRFCKVIIRVFGPTYLRDPNEQDISRLLSKNAARGWPGMLGSIDCMHWCWKNCPKAWHVQYCGNSYDAIIILEVIASQDLWIWHCFLDCRFLSMILMCYKGPISFSEKALVATTSSMSMSTTWDITLRMGFIRSGQHL